jgi:hydrogenase nickel incorporation protein HypA/HybF
MHEMGIAMEIVRIVIESIPADVTDPKVERINLKVGQLAAVVPQSLKFCFEIAAKETAAETAELHIEEIPVSAICDTCQYRWQIDAPVFRCPQCDSGSIEVLTGRELDIESIELAEE